MISPCVAESQTFLEGDGRLFGGVVEVRATSQKDGRG